MNLVLEGPKGSGKSTISDHFVELGYEYFHSDNNTPNDLQYHLELLRDQDNRVIDRFSVGEMIYPSIYGRPGKMNMFEFFASMNMPNTIYVILYAENEEILYNRIKDRNDKKDIDISFNNVHLSNLYFKQTKEIFNRDNILVIDISEKNSKEIIEEIKECAKNLNFTI